MSNDRLNIVLGLVIAASATACASNPKARLTPFAWPTYLPTDDDGFPSAGDLCHAIKRTVGQLAAGQSGVSRRVVGCPGSVASSAARRIVDKHNGVIMGEVDGLTLISVPVD